MLLKLLGGDAVSLLISEGRRVVWFGFGSVSCLCRCVAAGVSEVGLCGGRCETKMHSSKRTDPQILAALGPFNSRRAEWFALWTLALCS